MNRNHFHTGCLPTNEKSSQCVIDQGGITGAVRKKLFCLFGVFVGGVVFVLCF